MTTMFPETAPAVIEKPEEVQVLERAADILEEFGWCQCNLAKYANGEEPENIKDIRDPHFVSFCAMGAIWRAAADLGYCSPKFDELVVEADERGFGGRGVFTTIAEKAGFKTEQEWRKLIKKNDIDSMEASQMTAHFRSLAMERMPV